MFSIFLLCKIIDIAWCIAMVLISLKMFLIDGSRILNFSSIISIKGMWDVALALAVITISGSTFHPLFLMLSISAWYFPSFRVTISVEKSIIAICEFYELYFEVVNEIYSWV